MKKNVIKFCFGIILLFVLIGVVNATAYTWNSKGFYQISDTGDNVKGITFGDAYYEAIVKNGDITSSSEKTSVKVNNQGYIEIKGNRFEEIDTSKDNSFVFENEKGLIEAHYSVTEATSYKIGNIKFLVPKGGKVDFIDGKITVTVPKDGFINQNFVQKIDRNSDIGNYEVIYKPAEGEDTIKVQDVNNPQDSFKIKNFKVGNNDKTDFGIGFSFDENGNKEIFIRGRATINDWYELGREGLKESIDTYLFFDGEMHRGFNKAYISINSDGTKLSLGNSKGYGPLVGILPGNPAYPVSKEQDQITTYLQTLKKSHGTFSKQVGAKGEKMIPKFESLGFFNIYYDGHALRYAEGENIQKKYGNQETPKIFTGEYLDGHKMKGTNTIPFQIDAHKLDGNDMKYDYIINDENDISAVRVKDMDKREIYIADDGKIISLYDKYQHKALTDQQQRALKAQIKRKAIDRNKLKKWAELTKILSNVNEDDKNDGKIPVDSGNGGSTGTTTTASFNNWKGGENSVSRSYLSRLIQYNPNDKLKPDDLVMIQVSRPGCPPCIALSEDIKEYGIAQDAGIKVYKSESGTITIAGETISSFPRILFFKNGRKVGGFTGYTRTRTPNPGVSIRQLIARYK